MCEQRSVRICWHDSPHDEAIDPPLRPFHTVSRKGNSAKFASKILNIRPYRGGAKPHIPAPMHMMSIQNVVALDKYAPRCMACSRVYWPPRRGLHCIRRIAECDPHPSLLAALYLPP